MRWAILSDVHGNLEALEAVLAQLVQEGVDDLIFLGDAVGYGANPNECVELLQRYCSHWVVGNHDHAAVGLTDISYFNPEARRAILWCKEQLLPSNISFLESLPLVGTTGDFQYLHATPNDPGDWNYIFTYEDARLGFEAMSKDLCFVGHSHVPMILEEEGGFISAIEANHVKLLQDRRYIINVGSIGQPRDGDPRASFGILDTDEGSFTLRRVDYDVQKAASKIVNEGLPPYLAQRLFLGI